MMNIGSPSGSPADDGTFIGLFRFAHDKFLQGVDDMLPARVIAYDRATNMARVQPLISMVTTNNQQVDRAQVASVPVLQLGGGGFVLSFPIKTGDIGWIKANDRDISLFKQSGVNSPPNTQRKHSFEDALFIPDTMLRGITVAPEDQNNVVLQNISGSVRISMSETGIEITTPSFKINGVNVSSDHIHSGVQPGGGDSGPPV